MIHSLGNAAAVARIVLQTYSDLRNRWRGSIVDLSGAGLNSTPTLISTYVMFVICMLVPTVSYKRSIHERDKKGRVVRMRSIAFRFSGRKLAASLVASCSPIALSLIHI